MFKAAVIDLDGTLLNDDKEVSDADLDTLNKLGERNIIRIIATGRSLFSTSEVLAPDFPVDYLIFTAGGGIKNYKNGNILKSFFISSDKVKEITERLIYLKVDFQIRHKIPESHKYIFKRFLKKNPDFDRLNFHYSDYIKPLEEIDNLPDAARFIIISPDEKVVDIIENEFSEFEIIRASSPVDGKSVWMEIYPSGVNKGSSLKYLCSKLNINLSEIAGLGNDYNDIHFLDITGESFITENAPDILKKRYRNTVSNNNSPLTEIMKPFLNKKYQA